MAFFRSLLNRRLDPRSLAAPLRLATPLLAVVLPMLLLWPAVTNIQKPPRLSARPSSRPPLRWSNPHIWKGGHTPRRGETARLPVGRTILLDCDPPPLAAVLIEGRDTTLVFDDGNDRTLQSGRISVLGDNARFVIGTEAAPFRHRARVILAPPPGSDAAKSERMLLVTGSGASLELHGAPNRTSWTRLSRTVRAGDNALVLLPPPSPSPADPQARLRGWRNGDALIIAPTGFDAREAETRRIVQVSSTTPGNGETKIILDRPLRYIHWGATESGVDERAEVGLLSRNISIEGEPGIGGCVMAMGKGTRAHIDGAVFTQLGEAGKKGRYPMHFHLIGDGRGSYVRNTVIRNCYNRFVTVHGTNHVVVSNCVGYDTRGHGFFLEDGNETGNVFRGNLGVLARAGTTLATDREPSLFWVTNPDNVVENNAAAGADGFGFWYALPLHPTGAAEFAKNNQKIWPRRAVVRSFRNNVAHACARDGLFVDNPPNPPGVYGAPTYDPPAGGAVFADFTAYKNRRRGVWVRGSRLLVTGARLADNRIGATLAASESYLTGAVIVGESANKSAGAPDPAHPDLPRCGFEFYDGLVGVRDTVFVNFTPHGPDDASAALGALRYSPFFVDARNFVERVRFVNARAVRLDARALRAPGDPDLSGDGYRSVVFVDRDGSLTGSKAGGIVAMNNPLLAPMQPAKTTTSAATSDAPCVYRRDWNAVVCGDAQASSARVARLFVDNRDKKADGSGIGEIGPVRVFVTGDDKTQGAGLWGVPQDGPNASFQSNLRTGRAYTVAFHAAPRRYHRRSAQTGYYPKRLRITLRGASGDDDGAGIVATVPAPPSGAFSLTSAKSGATARPFKEAVSRAAFENDTSNTLYLHDRRAHTITFRLVPPAPARSRVASNGGGEIAARSASVEIIRTPKIVASTP